MTFLVDQQLPPALARWMSDQPGVTAAFHVADRGMTEASDSEIWRLCAERDWVLVSKDRDFADRCARRSARQKRAPRVLWVRLGNCRRGELLAAFDRTFARVLETLEGGEAFVELR